MYSYSPLLTSAFPARFPLTQSQLLPLSHHFKPYTRNPANPLCPFAWLPTPKQTYFVLAVRKTIVTDFDSQVSCE